MTRHRDPDRMMASYGALAGWGLLILVVTRHLVGFRTLAASLFFPSPLTLLVPLIVLPILVIGVGLFLASSFYTLRQGLHPLRGMLLAGATWTVVFLLANNLVGFAESALLPARWMEGTVWVWGAVLLVATERWFRIDRRQRLGTCEGILLPSSGRAPARFSRLKDC